MVMLRTTIKCLGVETRSAPNLEILRVSRSEIKKEELFMKKVLLAVFLVGIAGCQTSGGLTQATTHSVSSGSSQALGSSSYIPGERKEYLFKEKPPSLQKYPIRMFCRTPDDDACFKGINYQGFVGKKFYYTSGEPERSGGFGGRGFYKLRTETGEVLYHYRKQELSSVHDMDIVALNEKEAADAFKEESIVEGASTMLTEIRRSSEQYGRTYDLSNGGTISETQLDALRELSGKFGLDTAKIADQLVNFRVTYDKMEDRFFVQPFPYEIRDTYVIAYIGYKKDRGPWLRAKIHYEADSWLFIDQVLLVADNYRLETEEVEFQRDHSSGTIWEWMDVSAGDGKFYEALTAIASADEATIRFNGRQYYSDFDIPEKQKQLIKNILDLFQNMKGE